MSIPKSMKAIRVEKTGGPEVNVLEEIPVPIPGKGEGLVKVLWTGTNFIDNYFRSGLYPRPLPYTPGQDIVGILLSLPEDYVPTDSSDLPRLEIGQKILAPVAGSGSFAEYATCPISKIAPLPNDIPGPDGIAASTTAFTALALVTESYEVKKGDWVLVRAASGGVGLVLCQLCAHLGANVLGTVSSPAKADLAKQNGAQHVLFTTDSSEENVKRVLELSGGGVHVVYDGVGKDTFEEDFEVVRPKATIVTFGNASGAVPPFSPLKLGPKALKLTRPTMNPFISTQEDFTRYASKIFDLIKQGGLKFTIHKIYDFSPEGVSQSQIDIASRGTVGKLVIKVADE
ncbi:hypothetical protein TREMEDRAFT_38859 [Tremella mesenterica DSM 1558]|nr:uncharacterized protein TREMEDRAFT_38859 [Tremella mesenterica DSM 1558]EIW70223.1 hypothetical protein TREMEDRAFT_38859 [Tremella mesenterica DSM 1558]